MPTDEASQRIRRKSIVRYRPPGTRRLPQEKDVIKSFTKERCENGHLLPDRFDPSAGTEQGYREVDELADYLDEVLSHPAARVNPRFASFGQVSRSNKSSFHTKPHRPSESRKTGRFDALLDLIKPAERVVDTTRSSQWLECVLEIADIPSNFGPNEIRKALGLRPIAVFVGTSLAYAQYSNASQACGVLKRPSPPMSLRRLSDQNLDDFLAKRAQWLNGPQELLPAKRPECTGAVAYDIVRHSLELDCKPSERLLKDRERLQAERKKKLDGRSDQKGSSDNRQGANVAWSE